MLSSKEADVSIGARRVLDKITAISNLLKKKKRKLYNCTLEFNSFYGQVSLQLSFSMDGRYFFFLKEIRIKEISIRKKIHIVIVFRCQ